MTLHPSYWLPDLHEYSGTFSAELFNFSPNVMLLCFSQAFITASSDAGLSFDPILDVIFFPEQYFLFMKPWIYSLRTVALHVPSLSLSLVKSARLKLGTAAVILCLPTPREARHNQWLAVACVEVFADTNVSRKLFLRLHGKACHPPRGLVIGGERYFLETFILSDSALSWWTLLRQIKIFSN